MVRAHHEHSHVSRVTLIAALFFTFGVSFSEAEQPADPWVGKRVIQRYNNFPIRSGDQAELRSGTEIHIYRVVRRDGDKLWLEGDADGPSGSASIDQFVRLEEALPYLAERIRTHPDDVFYRVLRAAVLSDKNDFAQALEDWNKIVEIEPKDPVSFLGRAKLCMLWGELDKAISDFARAIKIDPDDAFSYFERARAYVAKQDYDRAIIDYDRAISIDPAISEFYYNRAWAWQKKGDKTRALADYAIGVRLDAALERRDERAEPPADDAGEPPKTADSLLPKLPIERAPEDPNVHESALGDQNARGVVPATFDPQPAPAMTGKPAATPRLEASAPAALAREAFGLNEPQTALEYAARAYDWLQAKMYDKVIADCDQAINLGSHAPQPRIYRGIAWREKNDVDKAIADFDEALRLDPDCALAYLVRSSAKSAKHQYDQAAADLAAAVRLDPQNGVLQNARAWMWATCPDGKYRDGKKAIEAATRACEITGWDEAEIIDTLAASYAEAGDFEAAVKWQTMAAELETSAKEKAEFADRLKLFQEKKPYRESKP